MADEKPTIGSQFLDEEGGAGEWKPGAERRVLKEINGHQYIVLEHAGENRGSWQFHSMTPYTPPGTAPAATASIATTDPATGQTTQVTMTRDQIDTDTAALKYLSALRAWEAAPDDAKNEIELKTAIEGLNQARTKGAYLEPQLQQDLAKGEAALAKTASDIRIQEAEAPGKIAETRTRTGLVGAQATGTQIDNMLKMLGGLGTFQEQRNTVLELFANGDIDEATADAVMDRLTTQLREGVSPEKRFEEASALTRQESANAAAQKREELQEAGRQKTALQTAQTTAATSLTGDEAARQRQLLSSAVTQQGNQAQAVNSFINNYQTAQTANPNPVHTGEGFMGGLSMIRDIFSSLKDLTQPSPQLGPSQNFIGNLLGSPAAAGGLGPPPVAGPAAPVGTGLANAAAAPPGPAQPDYLEDPLMAATAAEDTDTLLDPGDVAQIQQLRQTDPRRAVNLTVEAWQRAVRGSGQTTRAGRANATP